MMTQLMFRLFLCSAVLFGFASGLSAGDAEKLTVAVLVCEENDEDLYEAFKNLPVLITDLGKENNWDVHILTSKKFAEFPDAGILDKADVLVFSARRIGLPKEQMQKVKKYVKDSGKGLVAIRTASHGFSPRNLPANCEAWREFDRDVLGGSYSGHGKNEIGSEIENAEELKDSPLLKGVAPAKWHSQASVYFNAKNAEGSTVYQYVSSVEKQKMPLTWTRMYNKTRVAYTSLGHKTDYAVPAYKTLIRNLVEWAGEKH
ncbi:MAG: ThuA domain-containing protein [Planctomycetaceae bacterium]|jgi:type 1 glutamine amidotransferase|nr:ThuA domain-containing protein [Planctomycetaceae bacterium]